MKNEVEILLSTFNGERFIEPLLISLSSQTYPNWSLLVRDDGSSDNTLGQVKQFIKRNPARVRLIDDGCNNLGPCRSFELLLRASRAPYVMFCDQDDIWLSERIATVMSMMKLKEGQTKGPLLIYSDLAVVWEDLSIISKSFFQMQNIADHLESNRYYVAYKNPAPGCSMLLNRAAVEMSLPFGRHAVMHDWWIAYCCATKGELMHTREATIQYRQHSANAVGSQRISAVGVLSYLYKNIKSFSRLRMVIQQHRRLIQQAVEASVNLKVSFSMYRYFWELFLGKTLYPIFSIAVPKLKTNCWRYKG